MPESSPLTEATPRKLLFLVVFYLAGMALAERLTTTISTVYIGLVIYGFVLIGLIIQGAFAKSTQEQRVFLTLAFAPLIRLISLSIPLKGTPMVYWYFWIGMPIYLSIFVVARYAGFTANEIGLTTKNLGRQIPLMFLGIGLGIIEYFILRPAPLVSNFTLSQLWLPGLILLVFTGFLEEIIFRGMMQVTFLPILGKWNGLLYVSLIFAVLHYGYGSFADVIFVFSVAMLFGWIALRTGSILGVSLAHGVTNIALFLVFPFWIGQMAQTIEPVPVSTAPDAPSAIVAEASPFPGPIVIDDGDPGFSQTGGISLHNEQAEGGDLYLAFSQPGQASAQAVWMAEISSCGKFAVEVYIPSGAATSRRASYEIGHHDGRSIVILDQSASQGEWVRLGNFEFLPGEHASLRLTNRTGEQANSTSVVFDAARWVNLGPCSGD
jgi:membrane protease YdiL (CAAX protease family)